MGRCSEADLYTVVYGDRQQAISLATCSFYSTKYLHSYLIQSKHVLGSVALSELDMKGKWEAGA